MNIESLRDYCLKKKGAGESFPFGESTLVFKVKGKMFLATNMYETPLQFNAKCDPEKVEELRERYSSVLPGYHMNKKHWNTVIVDGSIPDRVLKEMIDESYRLVVQSLPMKEKKRLL